MFFQTKTERERGREGEREKGRKGEREKLVPSSSLKYTPIRNLLKNRLNTITNWITLTKKTFKQKYKEFLKSSLLMN
jgi:hypothetical protein